MPDRPEITVLLKDWSAGNAVARDRLMPLVYNELQRIARRAMAGEHAGHTLQPTALVHEVFARLIDADIDWQDRAHFYALCARMMRRLLVNHASPSAPRNAVATPCASRWKACPKPPRGATRTCWSLTKR